MEEQAEYLREAIPWKELKVPDNQDTIDLIAGQPNGIMAVLDSTCRQPQGTNDIFVQNLFNVQKAHPKIRQERARVLRSKTAKARAAAEAAKKNQKGGQKDKFTGEQRAPAPRCPARAEGVRRLYHKALRRRGLLQRRELPGQERRQVRRRCRPAARALACP
jgi:hypothetical protein